MSIPLGLTLELRDPQMRDLGGWLDEADALRLDFAERPLCEMPALGTASRGQRMAISPST